MPVILLTRRSTLRVLASLAALAGASLACAADSEPLVNIQDTAASFALAQIDRRGLSDITAQATALDSRLRLARCELPLQAFSAASARSLTRTTVGVRCPGSKPWTLYVPVTIAATTQAVFTRGPLPRGEALQREHLVLRPVALDQVPAQYFSSLEQVEGMELTQPVNADVMLSLRQTRPHQVIQRGQEVVILAASKAVQVRMTGIALKGGTSGELIPVRNQNSGRTIEAVVIDADTVSVKI